MKTLIMVLCLSCLAGCNAWHAGGFNRGFNNAYMMDQQMQQQDSHIIYYPQNNNNSTYWQEQNARNQYFESIRPQSLFNHDGTYR